MRWRLPPVDPGKAGDRFEVPLVVSDERIAASHGVARDQAVQNNILSIKPEFLQRLYSLRCERCGICRQEQRPKQHQNISQRFQVWQCDKPAAQRRTGFKNRDDRHLTPTSIRSGGACRQNTAFARIVGNLEKNVRIEQELHRRDYLTA